MTLLFLPILTSVITLVESINSVAEFNFKNDDKHFQAVYECLMGKYQCPNEKFIELKVLLPHIFQYSCDAAICDENTKSLLRDIIQKLIHDYPKLYRLFMTKYDPQNIYAEKLESVLQVKRSYNKPNKLYDFDQYDENY